MAFSLLHETRDYGETQPGRASETSVSEDRRRVTICRAKLIHCTRDLKESSPTHPNTSQNAYDIRQKQEIAILKQHASNTVYSTVYVLVRRAAMLTLLQQNAVASEQLKIEQ